MKKLVALVSILLILFACHKEEFEINNLNGNKIGAVGHAGLGIGHTYPMNSYESIMNCLIIGADGTEIDVQMTSDGVLVAFHDEFLEQSTNNTGRISDKTWAQLDGTTYNKLPYTSYQLVTLDELFTNIPNLHQYTFFLDCKNFTSSVGPTYLENFANEIIRIIDKHSLVNNVYVELKQRDHIVFLQRKRPDLKIFVYSYFNDALQIAKELELAGLTNAVNEISKEEVLIAHNHGIMVAVVNAHSKERNNDAIKKNVDFIQSDRIKHLLKVLK